MTRLPFFSWGIAGLLTALIFISNIPLHADFRASANYSVVAETENSGGSRATSAAYSNDGSIGQIVGISSVAVPSETIKSGYLGQIYEAQGLTITAAQSSVNEGASLQLDGKENLDDLTTLDVDSHLIAWNVINGPITSIDSSGLVQAGNIYQDTNATVQGTYLGNIGTLQLTVTTFIENFNQWSSLYFNAQQLSNPAISGLTASPQNDSIPNLLKFLFQINPAIPMSTSDRAALPIVETTLIGQDNYLTLTYRKNRLATGITVNLEISTDLQNWTTVSPSDPNYFTQNLNTDPTTGDPIVQVGVKTAGASKKFIRLDVISP